MAPSAQLQRAQAAIKAMKVIGFDQAKAKTVLKKLLKVYENNWEFIEAENYRLLVDSILDNQESEVTFVASKASAVEEISSIAWGVKRRRTRKRKVVKTSYIGGEKKKKNASIGTIEEDKAEDLKLLVEAVTPNKGIIIENIFEKLNAVPSIVNYSSEPMNREDMKNLIDDCLHHYKEKGDIVMVFGNIIITKDQINDLLTDQELSDSLVDAYAFLMLEKHASQPSLYKPFLYISCLHWSYHRYGLEQESKFFVQHVNKDSVARACFVVLPIANNRHWTLLVGDIKASRWFFFDSLPNAQHKAVLFEILQFFSNETKGSFDSDPNTWEIHNVSGNICC